MKIMISTLKLVVAVLMSPTFRMWNPTLTSAFVICEQSESGFTSACCHSKNRLLFKLVSVARSSARSSGEVMLR